jgi:hypothetical protein
MLSNNAGFLARTTLLHFERIDKELPCFRRFLLLVTAYLVSKMPGGSAFDPFRANLGPNREKSTRN